jgi:hypothetical protein
MKTFLYENISLENVHPNSMTYNCLANFYILKNQKRKHEFFQILIFQAKNFKKGSCGAPSLMVGAH